LPKDFDPGFTADFGKDDAGKAQDLLQQGIALLTEYQDRLAAQDTHALLVVLQGLDAAGKDSTIKHVMSGMNPQWVDVHPFKVPSDEELNHDYLWRYEQKLPRRGMIGIFNRSHYEDVLAARVRKLVPVRTWKARIPEIVDFESMLVTSGTAIVKIFLHISKDEQKRRFEERLQRPDKRWKFRRGDLDDRALWDQYQAAYEEALSGTSTKAAPWYIVPADHKWYRNWAISRILIDALESLNPRYPKAPDLSDVTVI